VKKCCVNCFESQYLNQIISRSSNSGNCDYCLSKNVWTYSPKELSIFFRGIIDLYEIDKEKGLPIEEQLIIDFPQKVFSPKVTKKTKELIREILIDDIDYYEKILNNPVRLRLQESEIEEVIIKPLSSSWDKFSEEIKTINRFHLVNELDLEKFKSLFKYFEKHLSKQQLFYRARICYDGKGYPQEKMGNPPAYLAKAGRANPEGISYLYLANDVETTLYEIRSSLFDYVSVGTFKIKEEIGKDQKADKDLKVVNLSSDTYDLFYLAEKDSLEEVLMHRPFTDKLEKELSKPRRKSDSELDYLPTQYLSELIKSMGFDGIEYQSSLHSGGYNIVVFNPEKFICTESKLYEIESTHLGYKEIK